MHRKFALLAVSLLTACNLKLGTSSSGSSGTTPSSQGMAGRPPAALDGERPTNARQASYEESDPRCVVITDDACPEDHLLPAQKLDKRTAKLIGLPLAQAQARVASWTDVPHTARVARFDNGNNQAPNGCQPGIVCHATVTNKTAGDEVVMFVLPD